MAVHTSLTVDDWHRLNRLLERGLEFEGAERTAWLEALGAEDRHLRAVLVDLLTQSECHRLCGCHASANERARSWPRKRWLRCGANSPAIASVHGN